MQEHAEATEKWTDQLQDFQQSNVKKGVFGIDGEPIELVLGREMMEKWIFVVARSVLRQRVCDGAALRQGPTRG